jgi:hypothetical protein
MTTEYKYECGCGERFKTVSAARDCRKCRQYLFDKDYNTRSVVDITTDTILWIAGVGTVNSILTAGEEQAREEAIVNMHRTPPPPPPEVSLGDRVLAARTCFLPAVEGIVERLYRGYAGETMAIVNVTDSSLPFLNGQHCVSVKALTRVSA